MLLVMKMASNPYPNSLSKELESILSNAQKRLLKRRESYAKSVMNQFFS